MDEERRLQHKLAVVELHLREIARQIDRLNQAAVRAEVDRGVIHMELAHLKGRKT